MPINSVYVDNINILKQSGADEIYDAYEAAGIGVSNIIKKIQ